MSVPFLPQCGQAQSSMPSARSSSSRSLATNRLGRELFKMRRYYRRANPAPSLPLQPLSERPGLVFDASDVLTEFTPSSNSPSTTSDRPRSRFLYDRCAAFNTLILGGIDLTGARRRPRWEPRRPK